MDQPSLSAIPPPSEAAVPSSSLPSPGKHTRTTSVSAVAAIFHHHPHSHLQQQQQQLPLNNTTPFQMHPWASERAKVAAESEISPPISPKQQAVVGGPQGGDFLEPLQESDSSNTIDNVAHRRQSHVWDLGSDSSKNDHSEQSSSSSSSSDSQGLSHSRSASLSHPNSPYTHQPHSRLRRSHSNTELLAVLSQSELPALLSSSSSAFTSSCVSASSSASSSSTSLSSVSSKTSGSHPFSSSSSSTLHDRQHQNSSLKMLDTETATTELSHIDTPPSSHVTSPTTTSSSLLYPVQKDSSLPLDLTGTTTTTTRSSTTPMTPAVRPRTTTWAPYHCTHKSIPQIIREISDLVDGRDKTIKVIQYFAKVFLWVFLSNPIEYKMMETRIKALAKQFSTTRKVLRLGHFIDPLAAVLTLAVTFKTNVWKHGMRGTLDKTASMTWRDTVRDRLGSLNSVLGFCQDISDDIYCLGVIGVLDRSFADKAEPWSNRLWMVGVSIDLHENLQSIRDVKKQIKALEMKMSSCAEDDNDSEQLAWNKQHSKLTTKLHWLQVTTVKLGGDFLFCAYDNMHYSLSDGFQAVTGFVSGIAGAYKFVGKVMES